MDDPSPESDEGSMYDESSSYEEEDSSYYPNERERQRHLRFAALSSSATAPIEVEDEEADDGPLIFPSPFNLARVLAINDINLNATEPLKLLGDDGHERRASPELASPAKVQAMVLPGRSDTFVHKQERGPSPVSAPASEARATIEPGGPSQPAHEQERGPAHQSAPPLKGPAVTQLRPATASAESKEQEHPHSPHPVPLTRLPAFQPSSPFQLHCTKRSAVLENQETRSPPPANRADIPPGLRQDQNLAPTAPEPQTAPLSIAEQIDRLADAFARFTEEMLLHAPVAHPQRPPAAVPKPQSAAFRRFRPTIASSQRVSSNVGHGASARATNVSGSFGANSFASAPTRHLVRPRNRSGVPQPIFTRPLGPRPVHPAPTVSLARPVAPAPRVLIARSPVVPGPTVAPLPVVAAVPVQLAPLICPIAARPAPAPAPAIALASCQSSAARAPAPAPPILPAATPRPATPPAPPAPASQLPPLTIDAACIFCFSSIANTVLLPCCHLVLCKVCAFHFCGNM